MKIVIGITGSVAAYKAADLVSKLKQKDADLFVVMTKSATELIGPPTLKALSGNPVLTELFPKEEVGFSPGVTHIKLASWMEMLVICPATANIIGKIAHGIADDLLSTLVLAATVPVIIAPAMNEKMYQNKVVQDNIKILQERGYHFVDPETGFLACGYTGRGRLAGLDKIIKKIEDLFGDSKKNPNF